MELIKQETFWVGFGSIATAVALIYTILRNQFIKYGKKKNIKKALALEIITNIQVLFSGEVERPPLFDVVSLVRRNYIQDIKSQSIFWRIQKLYIELEYYKNFVANVYLKPHIGDSGFYVTEKQLQTCNLFLEYFGENPIEFDLSERLEWNEKHAGREYMDYKRDKAIEIKKRKMEWWQGKIKKDIDLIFG